MNHWLLILTTFAVMSGVLTFENLKEVSQCPRNKHEWDTRAKTHGCEYSTEKPDVYHCALDDTGTKLYEVCAPVVSIPGRSCVEFDSIGQIMHNSDSVKCSKGSFPCPSLYLSNQSYKYQSCYDVLYELRKAVTSSNCIPVHRPGPKECWTYFVNLSLLLLMLILLGIICFKLSRNDINCFENKTNYRMTNTLS